MRALILLLVSLAVAFGADVAHWVAERGGIVQTDASSPITGVNLGFSWVTDADVEMLTGLKDLRKLDLSFSLVTDAGMEHPSRSAVLPISTCSQSRRSLT